MTRFWITMLQGRKLVRAVPPSENYKSYPTDVDSFQPSIFPVDLMFPDFEKHPRMDGMLVYEAILEPGDVMFMPEGWGHQALNLEWALMLTSNYVDAHNIVAHLDWNAAEGVRAPRLLCCSAQLGLLLLSVCRAGVWGLAVGSWRRFVHGNRLTVIP